MAFKTIPLSTPIIETRPDGTKIEYAVQYDQSNGDVQVKEVKVNGQPTQNSNPNVIFGPKDGNWNTAKIQDPNLTANTLDNYKLSIAQAVRSARNNSGNRSQGSAGANLASPEPQWVGQKLSGSTAGGGSTTPPNSTQLPGITGMLNEIKTVWGTLADPLQKIQDFSTDGDKWNLATSNNAKSDATPLIYPVASADKGTDRLFIQAYKYKPPYGSVFSNLSQGINVFGDIDNPKSNGGVARENPAVTKVDGAIYLPMPQAIRDSATVAWDTDTMSNTTMAATGEVGSKFLPYFAATNGMDLAGSLLGVQGAGTALVSTFLQALLLKQAAGGIGAPALSASMLTNLLGKLGYDASPESILARGAGVIPNSNQELLFRGPAMRTFSFTYQFTPRSAAEAEVVRKIIRRLKVNSAAKKMTRGGAVNGGASFFLGTPNIFCLQYITWGDNGIKGVHLFKPCALTRFETDYTPQNTWMSDINGNPMSYRIAMDFSELEPIYNTDYVSEGAAGNPWLPKGYSISDPDTIGF